jgi:UDP-N-acetylglucosamine diphosphorylase / glucose-1-phosphate thymidylyltransferase / UDP-N-acetylgalactosamine diphosphorylase / glucosamine-1-phosphate N-acetyltransferase / galactosamine-1-phosphate N-acetyltransferase
MSENTPSYFFELNNFQHAHIFDSCSFPWEALPKIEKYLKSLSLGNIQISIPNTAFLINPELISIGEGTVIEPSAYIKGPCVIGKNCTIRHGAYIRGNVITGDQCVIGHDTEVKNSIFLNKAQAAHFAYVGDCILGNGVNLGAGTKCANLKLDHQNIEVHLKGEKISTGLRKFGAILGDGVQLGCNSVMNPGTMLGKRVFCYPCVSVGGFVPEDHIIRPSQKVKIVPVGDID